MLTFNAERHEYAWQGKPVPGVTRVTLGDPFAGIPSHVLEHKRAIGLAAHRACELDALGQLDEATVHPAVWPYLLAWRAFIRESGFEVEACEEIFYAEVFGYAGRRDFRGKIDGRRAVVDFKTGLPGLLAAMQTAAYAASEPWRRFALQGLTNGRYRFTEYTAPGDFADFLACLRCFRLKERIANV
jgi:hypothetical protein